MKKISNIKLKIEGMHCTSCAMSIDFDLEDVSGVESSNTNYAKSISSINYDSDKVSVGKIIQSIKNTGYEARPI